MRVLYFHIGLGKTGSPAIQAWLSASKAALKAQGVAYVDLSDRARRGKASSGNGGPLVTALRADDFAEVERLIAQVYFPPGPESTGLISRELLKDVQARKLERLRTICEDQGIEPRVIAFVKSVYERAYSAYGQLVKHAGETGEFSDEHVIRSLLKTGANLKKYRDCFGERLQVLNYDNTVRSISESFAAALAIKAPQASDPGRKVNRSLSVAEIQVQRQLNVLHGGRTSAAISRHLIEASPDKSTPSVYDEVLVMRAREAVRDGVDWINSNFAPDPPIATDL